MEVSKRPSKKPSLGVLTYWDFHLNTFQHKLEPSVIHELYYKACRKIETFYKGATVTYLERDEMGWPVQTTIVQLNDEELGDSYILALVWQGNDSQQFYFAHMPGSYKLPKGSIKRETWSLEGILSGAKQSAEQDVAAQPATAPKSKSKENEKRKAESKARSQ